MAVHSAATLREFQGTAEPRLVFARAADRSVVWMPDGAAEQFRQATRDGDLVCIVPDCKSSRLKAVNRGARRHGFAHHAGAGGHPGMGVDHLQSQLLIAQWLRTQFPDGNVELEEATEDGRRRADVMFTSASGRKAAFEIQYAAITPRAWQERHDSYAAAGIVDIWLWGHVPPHLRRSRGSDDEVELNPTHEAVTGAGQPMLWINPELGEIGFATQPRRLPRIEPIAALATSGSATFHSTSLDGWRLTSEHGLTCDHLRSVVEGEADAERRSKEGATRAAAEAAAAREALLEKQRAITAFFERVQAKAQAREAAWLESPMRAQILKEFNGTWPAFLDVEIGGARQGQFGAKILLPFPQQQWQAQAYLRSIRGRRDGQVVSRKRCAESLAASDPDVRFADVAIDNWFDALVRAHVLRRERGNYGRFLVNDLALDDDRANAQLEAYRARARAHLELGTSAVATRPNLTPFEPTVLTAAEMQDLHKSHVRAKADARSERIAILADHYIAANAENARQQAAFDLFYRDSPVLLTVAELREFGVAIAQPDGERCVQCGGALRDPEGLTNGYHGVCAPDLSIRLAHPLTRP